MKDFGIIDNSIVKDDDCFIANLFDLFYLENTKVINKFIYFIN